MFKVEGGTDDTVILTMTQADFFELLDGVYDGGADGSPYAREASKKLVTAVEGLPIEEKVRKLLGYSEWV